MTEDQVPYEPISHDDQKRLVREYKGEFGEDRGEPSGGVGRDPVQFVDDQIEEASRLRHKECLRIEALRAAAQACEGIARPLEDAAPDSIAVAEYVKSVAEHLMPWLETGER